MRQYRFESTATETISGRAIFIVAASNERAARKLLAEDASDFYVDFIEQGGGVEWDATKAADFDLA